MSVDDFYDVKGNLDRLMLVMSIIADIDLEGFLSVVDRAHALGPFVDPTLYMRQRESGDMDAAADLARALLPAVRVYRERIEPKVRKVS